MAKFVFVNMEAFGHVNPSLPIVKELLERGHEVLYYIPESFKFHIEMQGLQVKTYRSNKKARIKEPIELPVEPGIFSRWILGEASYCLPDLLVMLSEDEPDLVVFDMFCIAARFAAQKLEIPWARLCPSYPSHETYLLFDPEEDKKVKDPELQYDINESLYKLRHDFEIEIEDWHESFNYADPLNIVFLPRSFHPCGAAFDNRFVFVGPSIEEPPPVTSLPPQVFERKKLLYISLGTAFTHWPEFFKMCFEAFADSEWQVLLSCGSKANLKNIEPIPQNFFVRPYMPQLEILQHTDVFISHGGMNSTMESIHFEVPLIVIPQIPEQNITSHRVADLGLGLRFDRQEVNAQNLRQAAERLHHNADVKNRLRSMSQICRDAGGYKKAAICLEEAATRHVTLRPLDTVLDNFMNR